jgi:hypothetical protein
VGQQILDEGPRRDRSGRNPARNIGEEHRGRRDQGLADGQLDSRRKLAASVGRRFSRRTPEFCHRMNLSEKDMIRKSPGDSGGTAGKSPGEQAWMVGGGPRLQGARLFPQAPSSPNPRPTSFQSGNPLSSSHASDGLNGGQKNGPTADVLNQPATRGALAGPAALGGCWPPSSTCPATAMLAPGRSIV